MLRPNEVVRYAGYVQLSVSGSNPFGMLVNVARFSTLTKTRKADTCALLNHAPGRLYASVTFFMRK